MIVVSPWSKGGWVCSEVFDHTSLIRFLEQRFAPRHPGLIETNITAWRRAVCGDLTSAFDFATPNAARVALPDTPRMPRGTATAIRTTSRSSGESGPAAAGAWPAPCARAAVRPGSKRESRSGGGHSPA